MNTRIIKSFLALVCIGVLLNAPLAQQTPAQVPPQQAQQNRIELHQALLDLTNPWTVMCIAAHPDDEDGTSLIVMRRKHGVHTVSLFTTFGEGGQNAIGPELYEELGAIRVRETIAASEIQGSEPHFLGLKDFGYSKSAEETYRVWGRDESLRRMVLHIRKLRPDVIITNHDTSRGHGHHQVTGQLVLEAFDAAADPKRFPEQLKERIQPWQVQRLFVRAFGTAAAQPGQKPDRQGGLVLIDPNERDPIRGTTYADQALQALQKHATQGPWPKTVADMARFRNSPDGKLPLIRYRLVREANRVATLPDSSHNLLDGLDVSENVAKEFAPPTIDGRPLTEFINQPQRVLDALVEAERGRADKFVDRVPMTVAYTRPIRSRRNFNSALAAASGVSIRILSNQQVLAPGSSNKLRVVVSNNGSARVKAGSLLFGAGSTDGHVIMSPAASLNAALPPGGIASAAINYRVPVKIEPTVPHSAHLYNGRIGGHPLAASVLVEVQGVPFDVQATRSIDIGPAVEIADISPSLLVLTPGTKPGRRSTRPPARIYTVYHFEVTLINHSEASLEVKLTDNTGGGSYPAAKLLPHGSKTVREFPVSSYFWSKEPEPRPLPNEITLTARWRGEQTGVTTRAILVAYADARVDRDLRVGYVRGFDYSLPNALAALGVDSKELSIADVRAGDLQKYNAILVDNRVYESQPELIATNQRLLDYAKDGGTLIVFYHKSNEWNPNPRLNRPQLAPYPIILNDERVTDETAPITFIEPQHQLLNIPNKIGQEDFVGWIQERGLYYPKEWDEQYRALLAMNDPGEAPLRGGLLVADYGRGHYIYTSMVWYRQLRAGVPGAYRMLGNMISYGK